MNLLAIIVYSLLSSVHPSSVDLTIHISNVKSATAPIRIALYDKSNDFPKEKGYAQAKVFVPGKTGEANFVFTGLADGEYAVAIYQDLDNNSKLNSNFFGYPNEPFGFSNNIRPVFSAPSFKKCKVAVSAAMHDIFVKLID